MNTLLDRFFHYTDYRSTFKTELIAGLSTFAAMAYIICIQPALFSGQMTGVSTGMPFGALLTTTCIASAIGSILMGVLANYPIGLAPGMGTNFFVLFSVMTVGNPCRRARARRRFGCGGGDRRGIHEGFHQTDCDRRDGSALRTEFGKPDVRIPVRTRTGSEGVRRADRRGASEAALKPLFLCFQNES